MKISFPNRAFSPLAVGLIFIVVFLQNVENSNGSGVVGSLGNVLGDNNVIAAVLKLLSIIPKLLPLLNEARNLLAHLINIVTKILQTLEVLGPVLGPLLKL